MQDSLQIRLAPAVAGMNAFLEPHRPWIERVLGCKTEGSITFELAAPFAQFAADELLKETVLDRRCLYGAAAIRPFAIRWEIPPGVSPRIELCPSIDSGAPITAKRWAWDPHWREAPVAIWLQGLKQAIVAASIPYVSYLDGPLHKWKDWLIVNRAEVAAALDVLAKVLANRPKFISVFGGSEIPLEQSDRGWDSLVLDAQVTRLVRKDFEFFLQHEAWFKKYHLPFQRGYLFFGPPGNGKTSVVRAMAMHPAVSAFSLDFAEKGLLNGMLSELFKQACHAAPSLIIFEDLDRFFGNDVAEENRPRITFQHLLNCLDGLEGRAGTVVVATANHPEQLDTAILCRPGRFDRLIPFAAPNSTLCREYITKLTDGRLDEAELDAVVSVADRFSFAQIQEAYIMAGQRAFERGGDEIRGEDLLEGTRTVRNSPNGIGSRLGTKESGFVLRECASLS